MPGKSLKVLMLALFEFQVAKNAVTICLCISGNSEAIHGLLVLSLAKLRFMYADRPDILGQSE